MDSTVELYCTTEKSSLEEKNQDMQQVAEKVKKDVGESQGVIHSFSIQLKEEILKRDMEFEKFVSEDLQKDIPTGKYFLFKAFRMYSFFFL